MCKGHNGSYEVYRSYSCAGPLLELVLTFCIRYLIFLGGKLEAMNSDKKTVLTENSADLSHGSAEPVGEFSGQTKALARRVIRKIDSRILLMMFVTYNLNFIDKTILSSAAVFGLRKDNNLVGTQYSWVSSIFYFGYAPKRP